MVPPDAPASGDCEHPYALGWERLQSGIASRIFVSVDIAKQRVNDISTDAQSETLSPITGLPFPQCNERT
jgi:hypothetical protein